ncbi:hypothetical protein [Limosilactobacillus sp.]|uniref:hypothetical protein n=1 Tax=Limosilactobacillus sp. TaxID=2773925 RepID=UPI00345E23E5
MKKIGLICVALLAGISLTACSNSASQKSNKKSSSSSVTTTKAVKHHKVRKESKKDTQSSSSSAVSSQSNSQASQTTTRQSSQNSSQQQAVQSNSNGLPPANDLHDFVNRYGESPAAYLAEHNGMSPEQAVQSVPDTMKTSGEIQDTYQIQQGQDPFN